MGRVPEHRPPGALRAGDGADVRMMICTAGHVDHGKTRLVKLLTGCETDRLKEERDRGLTIELGFAPCVIGDGVCIGIVDVPGHEKFIRTMVAGVSGIDMTVLVVAADDGIKPQTVEHLRIMELMGVECGIIALTKTDLVTPERLDEAIRDVRGFLKGTFLTDAEIYPVSSETFEGYPVFYEALVWQAGALVKKTRRGVFRMPAGQVFSRAGFGTVVTGIPLAGSVVIGDRVESVPGGLAGRVRGIQRFQRDSERGEYGQCLALNIPDFGKKQPVRGNVIGAPGYLEPVRTIHARFRAVPDMLPPLRNAEEITFHTGTAEARGKLYLLEHECPDGTKDCFCSIVLAEPVVTARHDRFIVRRLSPASTIAGGEILDMSTAACKPRKRDAAERLSAYVSFMDGVDPVSDEGFERRIGFFLERAGREVSSEEIAKHVLLPREEAEATAQRLVDAGTVSALESGWYIHRGVFDRILNGIAVRFEKAAAQDGFIGMHVSGLTAGDGVSQRVLKAAIDCLEAQGVIRRRGARIVYAQADSDLGVNDHRAAEQIAGIFRDSGFRSPRPDEIPGMTGISETASMRLIEYLCDRGDIVRLSKTVILSRDAFHEAQNNVIGIIKREGVLDSADFKHHIGSSRKYALAILDYLDAMRVTVRSGNDRVLSPGYERNLPV